MKSPVGHQLVKVFHDHPFGEHRRFLQGQAAEPFVESLVKGQAGVSELTQAAQVFSLIRFQLLTRPAFRLAQHAQGVYQFGVELQIHGGSLFDFKTASSQFDHTGRTIHYD